MYLGIDIGGTKTLVATLSDDGEITDSRRFPTDKDYQKFLGGLGQNVGKLKNRGAKACAAGIPATVIDRGRGIGVSFGNLPWKDVPIRDDIARICGCPVSIENDAKLAGLSEAAALKDRYSRVLYVTVSTGIGYALVVDGIIDTNVGDAGGRALMLEHDGAPAPWEDFAGGRAIVERYGKQAKDITDAGTWRNIARDLAGGLIRLAATLQPEVIVIGGAVGVYFDRYGSLLAEELAKYKMPLVPLPEVIGAKHPEEAVIRGCYELLRQTGDGKDNS